MRLASFVNRFFRFVLGTQPNGEDRVHFWAQNLNENSNGDVKGWPYHGRCNLSFGSKRLFHFSWNLWSHFCGVSFSFDPSEDGWRLHAALPPFSFWFSTSLFSGWMSKFLASKKVDKWNQKYGGYPGSSRYTLFHFIDIRIFNWALWWEFLKFDWGWSSSMPKWMVFTFHIDDFLLGKMKYVNEKIGQPKTVMVPMPEGEYLTKMQFERATWTRPRSPFKKVMVGYNIDIPKGIPHQGKGENSYDCGEDGLFGCFSEGESIQNAISKVQDLVLKSRRKYDGNMMAKYPAPKLDNADLNNLIAEAGAGPSTLTNSNSER